MHWLIRWNDWHCDLPGDPDLSSPAKAIAARGDLLPVSAKQPDEATALKLGGGRSSWGALDSKVGLLDVCSTHPRPSEGSPSMTSSTSGVTLTLNLRNSVGGLVVGMGAQHRPRSTHPAWPYNAEPATILLAQ